MQNALAEVKLNTNNGFSFSDFLNSNALNNTLGAINAVGSLLSAYGNYKMAKNQEKYNKEVLNMQKEQAQRIKDYEDTNNKTLNNALNTFLKEQEGIKNA